MIRKLFNKDKPGFYRGKHYTAYADRAKELKHAEQLSEAEQLLLALIAAVEAEDAVEHHGKAPWYTEQMAIIYRKQHRYVDELAILERYERGDRPPVFAERIAKVKLLIANATTG